MDAVIVAFVSGKGGTGKSTTSVFLGGALSALGKKVLLIELDSGLRSVDIIAGVSGQTVFDVQDVLSGRCEPEKALVESPWYKGLSIISAPYQGGEISPQGLQALCNTLRPQFDYILLDTAAGIGAPYQAATQTANWVVLVLTPDPVALRDGRMVVDSLTNQNQQLRLIINRVDTNRILKDGVLRDLDEAIDTVGVQLLGVIPESTPIQQAGATGEQLAKLGRDKTIYTAIARRITGEDVPLVFH